MDYETISGDVLKTTDAAILIDTCSGKQWVPRSLIKDGDAISDFSEQTEFEIVGWFVEQEAIY